MCKCLDATVLDAVTVHPAQLLINMSLDHIKGTQDNFDKY